MTTAPVHFVVPAAIDDPSRPSGGNLYDRRLAVALSDAGAQLVEHHVAGDWPDPGYAALAGLHDHLVTVPDDATVLVDGLIGSAAADVLVPHAGRLRLFLLVHLPLFTPAEAQVLAAVTGVIVTSTWTRDQLADLTAPITVAEPGVHPVEAGFGAVGAGGGGEILCVGAIARHKGHDVLLAALRQIAELPWHCRWVGPPDPDADFTAALDAGITAAGLQERIERTGPLSGRSLAAAYAEADLLVLPSRVETYGMVITEALAAAVPVLATTVGGVPATLGSTPAGERPGLLVPPDDPDALAAALRRWLTRPALRNRLRVATAERREALRGWESTARQVLCALTSGDRCEAR